MAEEIDDQIIATLEKHFTGEELEKIKVFLGRGFPLRSQIRITSIFLYAEDNGKSTEDVLKECQKEWEDNWQMQHPEIRADIGMHNTVSFENIYKSLGIPVPVDL